MSPGHFKLYYSITVVWIFKSKLNFFIHLIIQIYCIPFFSKSTRGPLYNNLDSILMVVPDLP